MHREKGTAASLAIRVPKRGLEPPRPNGHMTLNHARLPIPPLGPGAYLMRHLPYIRSGLRIEGSASRTRGVRWHQMPGGVSILATIRKFLHWPSSFEHMEDMGKRQKNSAGARLLAENVQALVPELAYCQLRDSAWISRCLARPVMLGSQKGIDMRSVSPRSDRPVTLSRLTPSSSNVAGSASCVRSVRFQAVPTASSRPCPLHRSRL